MLTLIAVVIAYLIGSISTSTILSRVIAGTDVRKHGSGNAGATNMVRLLGIKWGIVVLVVDALKGVAAVIIAVLLCHGQIVGTYLSALAVIAGHNWPLFFGFRGGKGIATTIGVCLSVHQVVGPALLSGLVAIVLLLLTRYVSLASLCFTVLTPIFVGILGRGITTIVFTGIIALFSLYRHRQNITRLVRGQEHRLFSRSA